MKTVTTIVLALAATSVLLAYASCSPASTASHAADSQVARGEYLVQAIGCADCHTPFRMGPNGPERDPERHLSGHPAGIVVDAAPDLSSGPWLAATSDTMTAWSGPWGISFTANLTPDVETGIGSWNADTFVQTIRNGRHMGRGRELLPPMPYMFYRNLTDEDLKAVFAYLRSIPAVHNRVPAPVPPPAR